MRNDRPGTSNAKRWLHYSFLAAAFICSTASLVALFWLGAPSWTTSVNLLALCCILFAVKTR
jgi:hypothetical protein